MSLKKVIILIFVGLITFLVILVIQRPELIEDFWLWLVGLAAPIIKAGDSVWKFVKEKLGIDPKEDLPPQPTSQQELGYPFSSESESGDPLAQMPVFSNVNSFQGQLQQFVPVQRVQVQTNATTLANPGMSTPVVSGANPVMVPNAGHISADVGSNPEKSVVTLELHRSEETVYSTLGKLTIPGKFDGYSIEGPRIASGKMEEVRIPSGTYPIDLVDTESGDLKKEWKPLKLDNPALKVRMVKGRRNIFIKDGKNTKDALGGILVGFEVKEVRQMHKIVANDNGYEELYDYLKKEINNGTEVRLTILDRVS